MKDMKDIKDIKDMSLDEFNSFIINEFNFSDYSTRNMERLDSTVNYYCDQNDYDLSKNTEVLSRDYQYNGRVTSVPYGTERTYTIGDNDSTLEFKFRTS